MKFFKKRFFGNDIDEIEKAQAYYEVIDTAKIWLKGKMPDEQNIILNYMIDILIEDICSGGVADVLKMSKSSPFTECLPLRCVDEEGNKVNINIGEVKEVDLSDAKIYVCPWKKQRIPLNLLNLHSKPFVYNDINHKSNYYTDIQLCHVYNGNHSIHIGNYLKKGSITSNVCHTEILYRHCTTDGMFWYNAHTKEKLGKVPDFRLAAVFSLAQMRYSLKKYDNNEILRRNFKMKQELIKAIGTADPYTEEVLTWLPDEAYDVICDIMKKIDEEGADYAAEQMQERVLKKYLPEDIFRRLMEIADNAFENDEWALEQVRRLGRTMKIKRKDELKMNRERMSEHSEEKTFERFYNNVIEWIQEMLMNDEIRLKDIPYDIRRCQSSVYVSALRVSGNISANRYIGDLRILADDLSLGDNDHLLSVLRSGLSVNNYLGSAELNEFENDISPTVLHKVWGNDEKNNRKLRNKVEKYTASKSD